MTSKRWPPRSPASTLPYSATSHAGAKLVLQVGGVEPDALQRVAPLADGHLEDRHAARAEQAEGADFGDDAGHLAHAQLADAARVQAVFVAEGQVVEQVFDGGDALLQQDLRRTSARCLLRTARW